jgi:hypothetical protein
MKFYRYLIYKLYSWGLKKKSDTPVANVIITLTFVHFVQLFTIYLILLKFFPQINIFKTVNGIYIGIILVVLGIIHYFLIYNKKRWELYLEEFNNEDITNSKRGNKLVLFYLIGSIALFFLLLPLLFGI